MTIAYFVFAADDPTIDQCIQSFDGEETLEEPLFVLRDRKTYPQCFNDMVSIADGYEWVFQVDGDQILYQGFSERVEELKNFLESNGRYLGAFSSYDTFEEKNLYASCKLINVKRLREIGYEMPDVIKSDRDVEEALGGIFQVAIQRPIALHAMRECGPAYIFSRFQNRVRKSGKDCDAVQSIFDREMHRWVTQKDLCAAAFLLGIAIPYEEPGEVRREYQKRYPERQWLADPTPENLKRIEDRIDEIYDPFDKRECFH